MYTVIARLLGWAGGLLTFGMLQVKSTVFGGLQETTNSMIANATNSHFRLIMTVFKYF